VGVSRASGAVVATADTRDHAVPVRLRNGVTGRDLVAHQHLARAVDSFVTLPLGTFWSRVRRAVSSVKYRG